MALAFCLSAVVELRPAEDLELTERKGLLANS